MKAGGILVLGAGGLMGRYLMARSLGREGSLVGYHRQELDITRHGDLQKVLEKIRPKWVINAAACARMEECAKDPEGTRKLNTEAPAFLADLGNRLDFRLCHVSSDYVFDGKASNPYPDDAVPGPLSEYARQKAAADEAVAQYSQHLILRVAWLFGRGGATFMSRMPELLMERQVLQVASGRKGNCLYMGLGAGWILDLIQKEGAGIFNLVHPGATTWEEFAWCTLEEMKRRGLVPKCERIEVVPMSAMAALQEPRPEYTGLALEKLEATLGRKLEDWKQGLGEYLDEIFCAGGDADIVGKLSASPTKGEGDGRDTT